MPSTLRLFISYAREDLPSVLNLKAAFDRAGVEAWLDKERLEATRGEGGVLTADEALALALEALEGRPATTEA